MTLLSTCPNCSIHFCAPFYDYRGKDTSICPHCDIRNNCPNQWFPSIAESHDHHYSDADMRKDHSWGQVGDDD